MSNKHIPVLAEEAVEALNVQPKTWYIDATFGRGGHTKQILAQKAKVLAFDWDHEAIEYGQQTFADQLNDGSLLLVHESFAKIGSVSKDLQNQELVGNIAGILFDFGTSTNQLTSSERGFSFEGEGTLDMRMDTRLAVTAADILQAVPERQLAELFYQYGGESQSKKIAKEIKNNPEPITTVEQLSALVSKVKGGRHGKLHPATKVFQALRIAVNSELSEIESALPQALEILDELGRIVTIAFHEGEDRIAKTIFKEWEKMGVGKMFPLVTPNEEELSANPRSRSAKMRIFEKKTTTNTESNYE